MNTSEICAVVRRSSSNLVSSPKLPFSSEKSGNVEKSIFKLNLEVKSLF